MLLCSIMNKILAHVIWNLFSFNFIQIKKNVPTFPEFGLYIPYILHILYAKWINVSNDTSELHYTATKTFIYLYI